MNIDLYDLNVTTAAAAAAAGSSSSPSSSSSDNINTQTLNEEVTQVFSQLGRFWGGVRKQSQSAFESARKDLGQVVSQAQKGIEKQFSTLTPASSSSSSEAQISEKLPETIPENEPEEDAAAQGGGSPQLESTLNTPSASSNNNNTFFSRLQSSLPPNLTPASLSTTLQRHLPENLQHGLNLEKATTDFAQLRATLVDNVQRVQSGTTIQQAEKLAEQYLSKGEALFKEAGFFLKDAIKVLPPEEGDDTTAGVIWDGTDLWPIPSTTSRKGKGKEGSDVTPGASSSLRSLGRRTEILLRKLRTDADEIRKNPEDESDPAIKGLWLSFTKEVEDNGGINGKTWAEKVEAVTTQSNHDEDIKELINAHTQLGRLRKFSLEKYNGLILLLLVPSEMTDEVFWTRYFFRITQIQQEEERRKALLEGTNEQEDNEEDFTWEEEEEEEKNETELKSSMETTRIAAATPSASANSAPTLIPSPSTQTPSVSPRRSEDSYDVVSSNVSSTGQKSPKHAPKEAKENEEDDSDWE
ncbi:hypothetical protein Clacol_000854 [Clathrus columnatus]|uniref:BSD domain-containing protein n=1 Tax=Clathrus columnatus TaxID=1419009 RepID=A0AAV4ZXA5_9AGAM|nr:hypothetical protein Clacol_000854 [Clathrus columnatus]